MIATRLLMAGTAAACLFAAGSAFADTADKTIALSNNYAGNSWRQAMLQSWKTVTDKAVADGVVKSADAFTTAENQATEQAAQIQNMILQGYSAIVINSASPTALNGAVKEACDAGIIVVSFDGIVTEPCAWRVAVDFKKMGSGQLDYLAKRYPDGGNLLEIRGLAGTSWTPRSTRASRRASRPTRSSRSSPKCRATGPRPWRRSPSRACCRAFRRSSAS